RGGLGEASGKLRMLGAPHPLPATLDRLDHQQVGNGLVVGEVRSGAGIGLERAHWANGTKAIGTPASDCRAFSVAAIQLSPSGSSTDAGRTRHIAASPTLAGPTLCSRSARAASISRRHTMITITSYVPRCSFVQS